VAIPMAEMITPPAKLASGEKHIIFPFVKYPFYPRYQKLQRRKRQAGKVLQLIGLFSCPCHFH